MAELVLIDWSKYPSAGLATLNRELRKKGIDSAVIKIPNDVSLRIGSLSRNRRNERTEAITNQALEYILRHPAMKGAKIAGMPMYDWHGQMRWEGKIIAKIKNAAPEIKIIGGGPGFNTNPKGFFTQLKLDYAIRGEAEHALPMLARIMLGKTSARIEEVPGIIMKRKGRVFFGRPAKLTREQIENSRMPLVRRPNMGVAFAITERGCAKACIFCSVPRKGNPIAIKDEEIINGILKLAKNKKIREIDFHDDQLFFDRERSKRIFGKIIELGLNKRFQFSGLATIDSFLITKEGAKIPDIELITLLKNANFRRLEVGTEALNEGMLKELKSGRYTAIEAMRVTAELARAGIKTYHFMLAGGVETKPLEFLETYYRALTKDTRRLQSKEEYGNMLILQAMKGTALYEKALREGCLVDERGRIAGPIPENKMGVRFAVPKDPTLREMFVKHIREGRLDFSSDEIRQMISLGERLGQTDARARKLVQRLKMTGYRMQIMKDAQHNKTMQILPHVLEQELAKRGRALDEKAAERFNTKNTKFRARVIKKAERLARLHNAGQHWMQTMTPQKRLETLKRQRQKMGFGAIVPNYVGKPAGRKR